MDVRQLSAIRPNVLNMFNMPNMANMLSTPDSLHMLNMPKVLTVFIFLRHYAPTHACWIVVFWTVPGQDGTFKSLNKTNIRDFRPLPTKTKLNQ